MKNKIRITFLFLSLVFAFGMYAQAPQKFSYQAIVRNSANALVTNTPVSVKISLLQGSASGATIYVETHTVSANANGLITFMIGGGNVVTGTFSAIAWGTGGPFFIQMETDPAGGSNYSISGTTQLLSVPYALYAETANNPGPAGPAGPAGPQGVQGVQGPSGVNFVSGFNGYVSSIATSTASVYQFAGATTQVTITSSSQKVIASASAPLGMAVGTTGYHRIGMCYQTGAGAVTNFVGGFYSIYYMTDERKCYSVSATVTGLTPGVYTIGMGIYNTSGNTISNNDYVNGWVMVTQ